MPSRMPVDEIAFTLKHVAGFSEAIGAGAFGDLDEDAVDAVLAEAGRFAGDVIAPLDAVGDRVGARLEDGRVTMPPGWREAYRAWAAGGWNGLAAPASVGGQGLPVSLEIATFALWNAASMAFALGPMLTVAAIEALAAHGEPRLRDLYAPRLASGEWMATMNLTEPQSGSDLSGIRTRAEPAGDGSFRLFGEKIFITYGEHDLTENIVHLVLARLPDAPAGTRGLSLFLVPKRLVAADGALGAANDVTCRAIERKLGLHASPTCVMGYGDRGAGAAGWLVGEPHAGLRCMFTMMNPARLHIGLQGVAAAEMATRKAAAYARDRRQGRAPGWTGDGMSPIIRHPDVKRMLLRMRALTDAARSIALTCAVAIDRARRGAAADRQRWQERANLLTPVAKAFATDVGVEVTSLGIQVHGGMGFIEETGAARLMRDARVSPIYEGTNGIQAADLVTRKLPQSAGAAVREFIDELAGLAQAVTVSGRTDLDGAATRLRASVADLSAATAWLLDALERGRQAEALAGATPYLRLFGLATGGALTAKAALADANGPGAAARALTARFYAETLLPETASLAAVVTEGGGAVVGADDGLVG
jgi:acyl-CoA dehydrogenase